MSPRPRAGTRRSYVVVGVLLATVLVVWLTGGRLLSLYWCEVGGSAYEQALVVQAQDLDEPNDPLDRALRAYQAAVKSDRGNAHAWRGLGEVYLTLGANEEARGALSEATRLDPANPIYGILLADAYDGLGLAGDSVTLWEASGGGIWRQDELIVNLLKQADAHVGAGDPLSAMPVLSERVLSWDDSNLFALATIVTTYDGAVEGEHPLADPFRAAAARPVAASLRQSGDARYSSYQVRAIVTLLRSGLWSRERVAAVADLWAWEGHSAAQPLLTALSVEEPGEPAWPLLLASLLVDRGLYVDASNMLLAVDGRQSGLPVSASKAALLAEIAEATGDRAAWEAAVAACSSGADTDLAAMRVLARAGSALGLSGEAERWTDRLGEATEATDRLVAADAAGVEVSRVTLGENVVANGDLESWEDGSPSGWYWADQSGLPLRNGGLFVGGEERNAVSGSAARVQCVWRDADAGVEAARAGFWRQRSAGSGGEQALDRGGLYVVSLDYRTIGLDDTAVAVLMSADSTCWSGDRYLPSTGGEWHHASFACRVSDDGGSIRPLIRLFDEGVVLFDDFAVRKVTILDAVGEAR